MRLATLVVVTLILLPVAAAEASMITGRIHMQRNALQDLDVPPSPPAPPSAPPLPRGPTLPPPPEPPGTGPEPEVPPIPRVPSVPTIPGGGVACERVADGVGRAPLALLDPVPLGDEAREPIEYAGPLCFALMS